MIPGPWFLSFSQGQGKRRSWQQRDRAPYVVGNLVLIPPLFTKALVYSQKCLEEKNEILQGKLSHLEEHLAQMRENPTQEKGEVLGDVLQVGMHRSSGEDPRPTFGVDLCLLQLDSCSLVLIGALVMEESC